MTQYKYVQIGFTDERLEEMDQLVDESESLSSRNELVRKAVNQYFQRDGFA